MRLPHLSVSRVNLFICLDYGIANVTVIIDSGIISIISSKEVMFSQASVRPSVR